MDHVAFSMNLYLPCALLSPFQQIERPSPGLVSTGNLNLSSFASPKRVPNSRVEFDKGPTCFLGSLCALPPLKHHVDPLGRLHQQFGGISAPYALPLRLMGPKTLSLTPIAL